MYKAHRRLFYNSSSDEWLSNNSSGSFSISGHGGSEDGAPSSFGEILESVHGSDMDCAPSQMYLEIGRFVIGQTELFIPLHHPWPSPFLHTATNFLHVGGCEHLKSLT